MAETAHGLADDDLRFIAETRDQVEVLYGAYRAGQLPVTPQVVTALSQIRQELLAIKVNGSINPAAADQRIVACAQIAKIIPPPKPTSSVPSPPAKPVPAWIQPPRTGGDVICTPDEHDNRDWHQVEPMTPYTSPSPPRPPLENEWPQKLTAFTPSPPWVSGPAHEWTPEQAIHHSSSRGRSWKVGAAAAAALAAIAAGFLLYVSHKPHQSKTLVTGSAASLPATGTGGSAHDQGSLDGQSGVQILQETLDAARQAGSAHVQISGQIGGHTLTAQADIGPNGGAETVQSGTDHAQIIVVGGAGYLNGSYGFLLNDMGVPSAAAASYADKWIAVPDSGGSQVGLTGPAVFDDLLPITDPALRPTANTGVVELAGVLPPTAQDVSNPAGAPAVLDVSRSFPYQPVSLTFSDPHGGQYQYVFTAWGEHTSFMAPPNYITLP